MLLLLSFYIAGIALILLSIYMRFWRGKRKFDRRNSTGNEQFNSYKHYLKADRWENAVQFFSMLFTVIGMILLLLAIFEANYIMRITHF